MSSGLGVGFRLGPKFFYVSYKIMNNENNVPDPFPVLVPYTQLPDKFENTFDLWVLPDASCILSGEVVQEPVLKYEKDSRRWTAAKATEFPEENTVCFYEVSEFSESSLDLALNHVMDLAGKPPMTDWWYQLENDGSPIWLERKTGWWHGVIDDEKGTYLAEAEGKQFLDKDIVRVRQWLRARY